MTDTLGNTLNVLKGDTCAICVVLCSNPKQLRFYSFKTGAMTFNKCLVMPVVLNDNGKHRTDQKGIGAGFQLQMYIGPLYRFRLPGIDNHHGSTGVLLDGSEGFTCIGNPVGLERIGAYENHVIGMLNTFGNMAVLLTKQAPVNPKVTRFFLGQRTVDKSAVHGCQYLLTVKRTQVISLASTTTQGKGIATMGFANLV